MMMMMMMPEALAGDVGSTANSHILVMTSQRHSSQLRQHQHRTRSNKVTINCTSSPHIIQC